jgi:hypothetical protein
MSNTIPYRGLRYPKVHTRVTLLSRIILRVPSWYYKPTNKPTAIPTWLNTIRTARSIALPGSGLLCLTQLPLSPTGVNLSRAAFIVPPVTKRNTIPKNAHSSKNWASNSSKLAVRVVVGNRVVALLQALLLNLLWQLPLCWRQRQWVLLPPQPLVWLLLRWV